MIAHMVMEWVKSGLHKACWDLIRYVKTPERPFQVLPYLVAEQLRKDAHLILLQIGANDGVTDDPLHELVLQHRLAGLFVEPLPDLFERLRTNYAAQPGVVFECCEIGRYDGEANIYRVRAGAPLPPWGQEIASFNRSHLTGSKFGVPDLERYVEEVKAPCLTLPTLLRKHGIHDLTLLQVDTEGFDCEIVRTALDAGLRPPIINYELIQATRREQADCKQRLIQAGYSFIDIGRDTLAVRR